MRSARALVFVACALVVWALLAGGARRGYPRHGWGHHGWGWGQRGWGWGHHGWGWGHHGWGGRGGYHGHHGGHGGHHHHEAVAPAARGPAATCDYFVLALSWAPALCEGVSRGVTRGERVTDVCGARDGVGFSLHGLWPEREVGRYASFCGGSRVPGALLERVQGMYRSRSLAAHEWRKHGTCSGLSAEGYFAATRAALGSVVVPREFRALAENIRIAPRALAGAFVRANGGLQLEDVVVWCNRGMIAQVLVCLDTELRPRACSRQLEGCKSARAVLPAVSGVAAPGEESDGGLQGVIFWWFGLLVVCVGLGLYWYMRQRWREYWRGARPPMMDYGAVSPRLGGGSLAGDVSPFSRTPRSHSFGILQLDGASLQSTPQRSPRLAGTSPRAGQRMSPMRHILTRTLPLSLGEASSQTSGSGRPDVGKRRALTKKTSAALKTLIGRDGAA